MYDAMSGQYILTIANGTTLSAMNPDANGNLIGYYENSTVGTMSIWNQRPFNTLLPNGTSVTAGPTLQTRVTIT